MTQQEQTGTVRLVRAPDGESERTPLAGDIDLRAKDRFETNRQRDFIEMAPPDRPPVRILAASTPAGLTREPGTTPNLAVGPTQVLHPDVSVRRKQRRGSLLRWSLFGVAPFFLLGLGILIGLALTGAFESSPDIAIAPTAEPAEPRVEVAPEPAIASTTAALEEPETPAETTATEAAPEPAPTLATEPEPEPEPATAPAQETQPEADPEPEQSFEAALAFFEPSQITFSPGTADLTASGRQAANELAEVLLLDPLRPVEIAVATSSETTPGLNHGLSEAQADAVTAHLISQGVDADRLHGIGRGSSASEQPELAGAILFGSDSPTLQAKFAAIGPLTFEEDSDVALFLEGQLNGFLDVQEAAATEPTASVDIVAYAWIAGSTDANHEWSHRLADAAVASISRSVAPERLSTVGMADRSISVLGQASTVTVHADEAAAAALAFSQIEMDAVSFEPSSTALTDSGMATLREVAAISAADPTLRIEVASHTYSEPTTQENHDLSDRQSRAVRDYLITQGVDPARLISVAHGDPQHFRIPGGATATTFSVIR